MFPRPTQPDPPSALHLLAISLAVGLSAARARAQEEQPEEDALPESTVSTGPPLVAEASDEARQSAAGFELAEGFEVSLWAAEPQVANPVCLSIDELGRVFVAETFRHGEGVTDIREHMDWLDEDLANQSVEDRLAMLRRHLGEDLASFRLREERVRRLVDGDGDGAADTVTVFADDFRDPAAGIAAGLWARGREVWYACLPDLWRLFDHDGDGVAEEREKLHTGFGVNVALLGHDLHGFALGHDGRMYFSVGDRGLQLETPEGRRLSYPKTGAVLSCELDGSDLRVIASGLRNPQELVFDERGDLFTCDNNSDGGDRARLVRVLEGGDSGWRYPYQWIETPTSRGPWNGERLWHPHHDGQPAWILPPIANFSDGPSGFTQVPGDAWGEGWQGHFLLCDFRGTPSLSGVHAFRLRPEGAGHELVDERHLMWGVLATDADFGPGGALFVSDWVNGWEKTGKGRIWRLAPEGHGDNERAAETRRLLADGIAGLDAFDLRQRLDHPDRRLRLEAQLALALGARDKQSIDWENRRGHLLDAAVEGQGHARLHGIWGLEIVARTDGEARRMLFPLLADPDPEVRAQSARAMGNTRHAFSAVKDMLRDPQARVRLFAAEALGKYGSMHAVVPLIDLVRENDDRDPWVRHVCVRALERLNLREPLLLHAQDESVAVRRAVLLVLRRLKDAEIVRYLDDPDPSLVAEAVRAIYDVPIEAAMDTLAARLPGSDGPTAIGSYDGSDPWILRRMLAANLEAKAAGITRLLSFARAAEAPMALRVEALELLASWHDPSPRDVVLGSWRPIKRAPSNEETTALEAAPAELAGVAREAGSTELTRAWIGLAVSLRAARQVPILSEVLLDGSESGATRAAALDALAELAPSEHADRLRSALTDADEELRARAFAGLDQLDPKAALAELDRALQAQSLRVRQAAVDALGRMDSEHAVARLLAGLHAVGIDPEQDALALELLEASAQTEDDDLGRARTQALQRLAEEQAAIALSGEERALLSGGHIERGRRLFREQAELSCLRCHRVGEEGGTAEGGEVGPNLSDCGSRLSRAALLQSILRPDAAVAEGYERWILLLDDDVPVGGRILSEDEHGLVLETPAGERLELAASRVVERRRDRSAMPADLAEKITARELRDLLEYLASLRAP